MCRSRAGRSGRSGRRSSPRLQLTKPRRRRRCPWPPRRSGPSGWPPWPLPSAGPAPALAAASRRAPPPVCPCRRPSPLLYCVLFFVERLCPAPPWCGLLVPPSARAGAVADSALARACVAVRARPCSHAGAAAGSLVHRGGEAAARAGPVAGHGACSCRPLPLSRLLQSLLLAYSCRRRSQSKLERWQVASGMLQPCVPIAQQRVRANQIGRLGWDF